jgi:hypothetical protein
VWSIDEVLGEDMAEVEPQTYASHPHTGLTQCLINGLGELGRTFERHIIVNGTSIYSNLEISF